MDSREPRAVAWIAILVFLAVLGVNLLGASYVATEGDPLNEQRRVVADQEEIRPSHLAQTTLFRGAWLFARDALHSERPFVVLQTVNAILGAATGLLILLVLLRLGVSRLWAVTMALIWAVSFAPWLHSRTAETGVTAVPFLLGALLLLLRRSDGGRPPASSNTAHGAWGAWSSGILAALLISAAVLLSLYTALLIPAFLYLMWRRGVLLQGTASLAVLLAVPFAVALLSAGVADLPSAVVLLTHHPNAEMLRSSFDLMSIPRALSGIARLLFPFSLGESAIKMKLAGHGVEMGASEWSGLLRNVSGALVLLAAFLLAWWRIRRSVFGWFLLIGGLPVSAFCVYWLGSDPQFWLPFYSIMLVAVGTLVHHAAATRLRSLLLTAIAGSLLIFMFSVNRSFGPPCPVAPRGSIRWQEAQRLAHALPRDAVVYIPGPMVHLPFGLLGGARSGLDIVHLSADSRLEGRKEQFLENLCDSARNSMSQMLDVYAFIGQGSLSPASLGAWEGLSNARGVSRAELDEFLGTCFATTESPAGCSLVELGPLDGDAQSN